MRRLVIDTATEACSIALFDEAALIGEYHEMLGRGHAEKLVPAIAQLPKRGKADEIYVNCGPGSFTGIRVGIAAARALAFAWSAKLHGYSTHQMLQSMTTAENGAPIAIGIATNGGHGEFFVQQFSDSGLPDSAIRSMKPADAARFLHSPLVAGSAAAALIAQRGYGQALEIWPDARRALPAMENHSRLPPDPIYGRNADAKPMRMKDRR